MKSILLSYLLCHALLTFIALPSVSAEDTKNISSFKSNKIATVKTFTSKDNAERSAEKLRNEDFEVDIREVTTEDNETIYRVFGKKQPISAKESLSTGIFRQDENITTGKGSELQKYKSRSLVILSPRERAEFRDINKITFSWLSVPHAVSYHFILAKDRSFTNIVHEENNIDSTSYTVGGLNYGTYFFKVLSRLSDNSEGPVSETLSFIIVPPEPSKLPLYFLKSDNP